MIRTLALVAATCFAAGGCANDGYSVTGTLTLQEGPLPPPPAPDDPDQTLDSLDHLDYQLVDHAQGTEQDGELRQGPFAITDLAGGDYTLTISAVHDVDVLIGTGTETLGSITGDLDVTGDTDLGTVVLPWQPEY
ncbi:MAG TPA: hypothetical protein VMJ10_34935 [Kofleriaceae bacterium]|nr:hypothetical protein [Kofleriaceae bacterium]